MTYYFSLICVYTFKDVRHVPIFYCSIWYHNGFTCSNLVRKKKIKVSVFAVHCSILLLYFVHSTNPD